jgi:hypothetical protein
MDGTLVKRMIELLQVHQQILPPTSRKQKRATDGREGSIEAPYGVRAV